MRRNEATLDRSRAKRRHGRGVWRGVFLSEERERERERDRIGIGIWISRSEKKERKKIVGKTIDFCWSHHHDKNSSHTNDKGRKEGRKEKTKEENFVSYYGMTHRPYSQKSFFFYSI